MIIRKITNQNNSKPIYLGIFCMLASVFFLNENSKEYSFIGILFISLAMVFLLSFYPIDYLNRRKNAKIRKTLQDYSSNLRVNYKKLQIKNDKEIPVNWSISSIIKIFGAGSKKNIINKYALSQSISRYDLQFKKEIYTRYGKKVGENNYYISVTECSLSRTVPHMAIVNDELVSSVISFDNSNRNTYIAGLPRNLTLYSPVNFMHDSLYLFTPDVITHIINFPDFSYEIVDNKLFILRPLNTEQKDFNIEKNLASPLLHDIEDNLDTYYDFRSENNQSISQSALRLKSSRLNESMVIFALLIGLIVSLGLFSATNDKILRLLVGLFFYISISILYRSVKKLSILNRQIKWEREEVKRV